MWVCRTFAILHRTLINPSRAKLHDNGLRRMTGIAELNCRKCTFLSDLHLPLLSHPKDMYSPSLVKVTIRS